MPDITRRELKRITARLEVLYAKLDGKKKAPIEKGADEFTNIQAKVSEECVAVKQLIKEKESLQERRENFIQVTKVKSEIKAKLSALESLIAQLRTLNKDKKKSKNNENLQTQREAIIEKLEAVVEELKASFEPSLAAEPDRVARNRIALKDLKTAAAEARARGQPADEAPNADDAAVLGRWQEKDRVLDDKLGDINLLLAQLKEQNKNISEQIDVRDHLVDGANREADNVNAILEEESDKLAKVLKSYRSPSQLVLDIVLVVLLFGLISVIVMLVKNGK